MNSDDDVKQTIDNRTSVSGSVRLSMEFVV